MIESKVEVKGFEAKHYDFLLQLGSFKKYGRMLKNAIAAMNIQPDDAILDLGCGTGKNACLMAEYLRPNGRLLGIDIGEEMISQFQKKCDGHANISIENRRIEEPLPYENEFNKVFLSFVFHGFPDEKRNKILSNARRALKANGQLVIFDFNEFDLDSKPFWFRIGFKKVECPLAFEYITMDWKSRLREQGFDNFVERFYFMDTIRLLIAHK